VNIQTLRKRYPAWTWAYHVEFGWRCYFGTRGHAKVRIEPYSHKNGVWLVIAGLNQCMLGDWSGEP